MTESAEEIFAKVSALLGELPSPMPPAPNPLERPDISEPPRDSHPEPQGATRMAWTS